MTGWSTKQQIEAITQILYPSSGTETLERIYRDLIECSKELKVYKKTLQEFVRDSLKDEEMKLMVIEKNPDVNPNLKRMDKALESSGIDPATYKHHTAIAFSSVFALVGNVMVSIRV